MADFRENVVLSLKPILKDSESEECIPHFLNIIDHLQLFALQKTSLLQDIIGHIHACLGSAKNRLSGLLLLRRLLEQCPTTIFTQNVHTWLNLLVPILQGYDQAETLRVACQVLNLLLEAVTEFPELSRHVASNVVGKLIPALLTNTPEWRDAAFESLCCLCKNFGGASGQHKGKIKAAVLEELKLTFPCKNAIRCYGLLARCGNAGNRGANHEAMWEELCQQTLTTLHTFLSHLYSGFETGDARGKGEKESEVSQPDSFASKCELVGQFRNYCLALQALLSETSRYPMTVAVSGILSVVYRCLRVTGTSLSRVVSTDRLLLLGLLPTLHESALGILSQLISCCHGALFHVAASVWELLLVGLSWTHPVSQSYGTTAPYHQLRAALFRVAAHWLATMREGAGLTPSTVADLADEIRRDITPVPDTFSKGEGEALESTARKKRKHHMLLDMSSQRKISRAANGSTVIQALAAMSELVKAVGPSKEQSCLKGLYEALMQVVTSTQRNPWNPPLPYGVAACRLALYDGLSAFASYPLPLAADTQTAIYHRLQAGLRDQDLEVQLLCQDAMLMVEGLLHPRQPPSLHRSTSLAETADSGDGGVREAHSTWSGLPSLQELVREAGRKESTARLTLSSHPNGFGALAFQSADTGAGKGSTMTDLPAEEMPDVTTMPVPSSPQESPRPREAEDPAEMEMEAGGGEEDSDEDDSDKKSDSESVEDDSLPLGKDSEDSDEDSDDVAEEGSQKREHPEVEQQQQQQHPLMHHKDSPCGLGKGDDDSECSPSSSKRSKPSLPDPSSHGNVSNQPAAETEPGLSLMLEDFRESDSDPE